MSIKNNGKAETSDTGKIPGMFGCGALMTFLFPRCTPEERIAIIRFGVKEIEELEKREKGVGSVGHGARNYRQVIS